MASHESLPDDQRALLQLLLKQGKSYDDLAALLKSDRGDVRRRAHDAVDALGPQDSAVSIERRNEIADYLLGQQRASQRALTREYLEDSAPGRGWARATAGSLRPIGGSLPEVPAEPAEIEQAFDALDRRTARRDEVTRGSRTGGRLLFGGLGLILAIGLLWVFGAFDGKDNADTPTTSTATTQGPLSFEPLQTAIMKPAKGSRSKAEGVAVIARRKGTQELSLAIQALKLRPSPSRGAAYGAWLYTSPTTEQFLGFTPVVRANGALQGAFQLVKDTAYNQVLLTLETRDKPTKPGRIVLSGPLQLVPANGGGQQTQPPQTQTQPAQTAPQP